MTFTESMESPSPVSESKQLSGNFEGTMSPAVVAFSLGNTYLITLFTNPQRLHYQSNFLSNILKKKINSLNSIKNQN